METMEVKKKRTRRTLFPLLIILADEQQQIVINSSLDLPLGKDFKILETNYKSPWARVKDEE